ncbi:hypothetical protein UFOVP1433_32 [uncultured Caudovirales phage]|uniref:Uncharacterized protein n=1 Tax=uncultured Caudovirales phage TaxID=2100421 RepID=A0A6J5QKL1_9CAUD|nr:hypothetical protein UFOVP553_32 [uncultured Caudovirales phage]CAB4183006.1 hypothetical protein UFOVP1081_32 [uncultured Caudovirales phage]CAB4212896.1 hypothetical protein UFOVP1433_32 [uncultured Caudovirales phage]
MEYLVITTAPWTAPNGEIVPVGMAINSIEADSSFDPGHGLALQIAAGQPWYAPRQSIAAPTTIATLAFMQRLTVAERQAIIVAARTSAEIQDWRDVVLAVAQVDVTDPLTIAGINSMATAGLLTEARSVQILDLSKASP